MFLSSDVFDRFDFTVIFILFLDGDLELESNFLAYYIVISYIDELKSFEYYDTFLNPVSL